VACRRLRVIGDIRFGRGIVLRGEVELRHDGPEPRSLADGSLFVGDSSL
jgi:hypothetical protein